MFYLPAYGHKIRTKEAIFLNSSIQPVSHGIHHAILENRSKLMLTGVTDIDSFDDRAVILYTQLGELTVFGKNLHMNQISIESGEVSIDGEIHAMRYGDRDKQAPFHFLGKLFR